VSRITTVVLAVDVHPDEAVGTLLAQPYPGDDRRQSLAYVSDHGGGPKVPSPVWLAGFNYLEWDAFVAWLEALPLEDWQREAALLLVEHEMETWEIWRFKGRRLVQS